MVEYSCRLADFVVNMRYDALEEKVVEKTKMHILDTLGVTLGAFEMPWSRMVAGLARGMGGSPQSTVMGVEGRYPMLTAALANGTMAHGIDMDDSGARPSWAHPGSCIVPAAYASGEAEKVNGRDLITAVLAGYEVNCRIDSAVYPGLRNRGFHATGVAGTFGAAAAAGRILGLDEEELVNAFGLAGTQAAGLEEWLSAGDMSKRLHAGKAAMNGVLAALLAREGYTGPSTVLEGKYGLLETHAGEYDPTWLTEGLGEGYKIMGCKFKPYACCHELCPPIRLALQAKEEYGFEYDDIEEIRIGLNHITAENQLQVAETPLHAQNHPAVAVAIALVEGQVFLKEFFESYDDPRVVELGKKIVVYTDPEIDEVFPSKIGTRVEITARNDKITIFEEDKPPVPYSFVKEKFRVLASTRLPEERVEKILDVVDALEDLENILDLSALL